MNPEFEDDNEKQEEEIDWMEYASQQEEQALRPLDGKDYVAIFIASIQTIFLPLVILVIVLFAFNFLLQVFAPVG